MISPKRKMMKYAFLILTLIQLMVSTVLAQSLSGNFSSYSTGANADVSVNALEKSTRYKVNKKIHTRKPSSLAEANSTTKKTEPVSDETLKQIGQQSSQASLLPQATPTPTPPADSSHQAQSLTEVSGALNNYPGDDVRDEEGLGNRVRGLLLGGDTDEIRQYKSFLHPQDNRLNLLEIRAAPAFIYNDSRSNSWYRSYVTASPGFILGVDVWLTPMLGVESSYRTSYASDVSDSPSTASHAIQSHEWFDFRILFRRFFGFTVKAPSITYGMGIKDYQNKVPVDDTGRLRTRSMGASFTVDANFPTSPRHSWQFGIVLDPFMKHTENSQVIGYRSGADVTSHGLGFSVGNELKFYRTQRLYWKLSEYVEKDVFNGQSNGNDPTKGAPVTGVSVTNTFTFFELGYIWGH